MTQEERQLIDRYIDNSLTGVELRDFIDKLEADVDFKKKVSFHNLLIEGIQEAEDKRLISLIEKSLHYKKPKVPFALKLIVTFFLVTIGGITLWNYIGPGSTGERRNYFSLDLFRYKKKDSIIDTLTAESATSEKAYTSKNKDTLDTVSEGSKTDEVIDSTNTNQLNATDIIVKKDQLIITYYLYPTDIRNTISSQNNEIAPASSINSVKGNIENEISENVPENISNYTVEFWVSPINYRGYQLLNDKIVLFGIERPDAVELIRSGNKLWMKYGSDYYALEQGEHFESFVELNEIPFSLQ